MRRLCWYYFCNPTTLKRYSPLSKTYRENLKKLTNFVLVKFEKDSMVQPRISEWFGFYKPGQSVELETLHESKLYTEVGFIRSRFRNDGFAIIVYSHFQDRLGLKEMDEAGKLHFLSVNADHLQFTGDWFVDEVIHKFLI